jgi:Cation efflux family
VARYKLVAGRRIGSATLVADARHSWLDALSSAGALAGLVAVAFGQPWGDPVAGLVVTAFICHVGYQVTADVVRRLADGVDPRIITTAEAAAGSVPGVIHAHARARWTGWTLRVKVEGWVDRICPSVTLTGWAARSPVHSPGSFPKLAASPGRPAPRPARRIRSHAIVHQPSPPHHTGGIGSPRYGDTRHRTRPAAPRSDLLKS